MSDVGDFAKRRVILLQSVYKSLVNDLHSFGENCEIIQRICDLTVNLNIDWPLDDGQEQFDG